MQTAAPPIRSARWIAADVETTALSSGAGRVIEVAAILFSLDPAGPPHAEFASLVNPGVTLSQETIDLTGITQADVDQAPPPERVYGRLIEFMRGADYGIAHSSEFDAAWLSMEFDRLGLPMPTLPLLCTVSLSRRLLGRAVRRHKLASLVDHFGIQQQGAHRALSDTLALVAVFRKLAAMLPPDREWPALVASCKVARFQAPPVVQPVIVPVAAEPERVVYLDAGREVLPAFGGPDLCPGGCAGGGS